MSGDLQATGKELERLAALAMDEAKKLGCDHSKVAVSASFQTRLVVENKQFSLANSLASRSLGILVHKDKKKGSASINTTTEASVRKAVADALALATYSVPDEDLVLATAAEAPAATKLPFLYDQALAETPLETIQGWMAEVLARLCRDQRVALDRFEMQADASYHGIMNSHGVKQTESQTQAAWSFFGMARDADEVTGFDYDGGFSFTKEGLLERALKHADEFSVKLLSQLKPRKCPSYKGPVLFTPRAVQEILTGMILYHAGGRQVMDGKSKWNDDVGKRVVSDKLTLIDEPLEKRFAGATSFDADGVPTRRTTILDKGVLKLHLHDCYSAKRTKTKTSGHAGGPFALRVAPGTEALAKLQSARGQLLVVDRFSGNNDPIKGDFSGVAKASRLFENGKDAGAVTETMIAGNFFEMAQAVLGCSRESVLIGGGFESPAILVDGVSVTGQG